MPDTWVWLIHRSAVKQLTDEGNTEKKNREKTALPFIVDFQDTSFYMYLLIQPSEDLSKAIHCSESTELITSQVSPMSDLACTDSKLKSRILLGNKI